MVDTELETKKVIVVLAAGRRAVNDFILARQYGFQCKAGFPSGIVVVEVQEDFLNLRLLIKEYMPFEDEVAIVCHEEGKLIGLPPNRAIYAEPETVELTYSELADRFRNAESEGKKHLTGYIVFSQESFNKPYDEKSRTYAVSSDNKAFKAGLGGYSIYGSCLDGSDPCVRLDGYMRGENAWKIEKCYLKEASREMLDIICGKFFICHAPYEAERFQSLPPDLAEKYREKFQYPERFARINDKIVAVPFKPAKADRER